MLLTCDFPLHRMMSSMSGASQTVSSQSMHPALQHSLKENCLHFRTFMPISMCGGKNYSFTPGVVCRQLSSSVAENFCIFISGERRGILTLRKLWRLSFQAYRYVWPCMIFLSRSHTHSLHLQAVFPTSISNIARQCLPNFSYPPHPPYLK